MLTTGDAKTFSNYIQAISAVRSFAARLETMNDQVHKAMERAEMNMDRMTPALDEFSRLVGIAMNLENELENETSERARAMIKLAQSA